MCGEQNQLDNHICGTGVRKRKNKPTTVWHLMCIFWVRPSIYYILVQYCTICTFQKHHVDTPIIYTSRFGLYNSCVVLCHWMLLFCEIFFCWFQIKKQTVTYFLLKYENSGYREKNLLCQRKAEQNQIRLSIYNL